jgi:succinate dehydrogenase flavin-adding protein (antitoxin of CptAB toxin-antitoxin module)
MMDGKGNTPTINRGRLRWLASRHALLELDILFRRFLDEHFDRLDDSKLAILDELLALEDHDLWAMISGRTECSEARWKELVEQLRTG